MKKVFQRLFGSGAPGRVSLEQQVDTLAGFGLPLNDGATIDDLLVEAGREEYECSPYDLIFYVYGSEFEHRSRGWQPICERVWDFDLEYIDDDGSYVEIVNNYCRVAGMPDLVSDVRDSVDIENGVAWLAYTIDGEERRYDIRVDDDWADPATVDKILKDIERNGKRFYSIDNGQGAIWFYFDDQTAAAIKRLGGKARLHP